MALAIYGLAAYARDVYAPDNTPVRQYHIDLVVELNPRRWTAESMPRRWAGGIDPGRQPSA